MSYGKELVLVMSSLDEEIMSVQRQIEEEIASPSEKNPSSTRKVKLGIVVATEEDSTVELSVTYGERRAYGFVDAHISQSSNRHCGGRPTIFAQ